ncbi:hypothetical protein E0H76_03485 [Rhizobium leguminosarum bv. viciae]|uniref:Uncharacterized protein n=1 Tax=Rhizobium leguminosarum TaxID=384 RepID=A0A7M3DTW2_RHILE|nr:hypothetical protein ELH90_10625 [Rhizobium leguminosarum]TBY29686.1 hypothetical protein E0H60_32275 [Rhizobium leguminosarum bv. viciae]TCA90262.1 hypothetical protein E0H74_03485 [Rhizobium leguminosarum bv. viciae]TCB01860.1 hypothetical protein E0H76_03485 [Rhizobium leguminosarum bv. viciae]
MRNVCTNSRLYSQDATLDMDRQRFTREVLTGYSNIAKTSLVSFQQGCAKFKSDSVEGKTDLSRTGRPRTCFSYQA